MVRFELTESIAMVTLAPMNDDLFAELLTTPEGGLVDFKRSWYDFSRPDADAKFFKDIISFANTIRPCSAYIISGIELRAGQSKNIIGIQSITDDSRLQQMARSKIYPLPCFLTYEYIYNGLVFGIVEIPLHTYNHALGVSSNMGNILKTGEVYLRRGSANEEADASEIAALEAWLAELRKRYPTPPDRPENDDFSGYLPRTVRPANGDQMFQYLLDHDPLEKVIEKEPLITLVGYGLSGKSTELIRLAHVLSSREGNFVYRIPLNNHLKGSISKRIPGIKGIPKDKLYVLLDGLDELEPRYFKAATRRISRFIQDYPSAHVIVSCRTNFYATDAQDKERNTLARFETYHLDGLSSDTIGEYLDQYLSVDRKDFEAEVDRKDLSELLTTPYYLIKLVGQYKLPQRRISDSKAALFREEILELIGKDIGRIKPDDRDRAERELLEHLTRIAFVMAARGLSRISRHDLNDILPDKAAYKKVKNAANLFQGSDSKPQTWQFNHNNTRDYLAASVLAKLKFREVRTVIAIKPELNILKPGWLNALSFLIDLLDRKSPLLKKLYGWLARENRAKLIQLDAAKMPMKLRKKVFRDIFGLYKAEGRRINRTVYEYNDLARFSEDPAFFDLLLAEIDENKDMNSIANALSIINFYQLKDHPVYREAFRERYLRILDSDAAELHLLAIAGLGGQFRVTKTDFMRVFRKFKGHEDTWMRYQLFLMIWMTGHQDEVVGYLLAQAKFLQTEEYANRGRNRQRTRLSNEFTEIAHALQKLSSAAALTVLFRDAITDLSKFAYSTYFDKIYGPALKKAVSYPLDGDLTAAILDTFIAHHSEILHRPKLKEPFMDYLQRNGRLDEVLQMMYQRFGINAFNHGHTMAQLATRNFIDFLLVEKEAGRLQPLPVTNLYQMMCSTENPEAGHFKASFLLPDEVQVVRRRLADPAEAAERDLATLFNQANMLQEVEKIYRAFGRDVLNLDDRYSSGDTDFWSSDFADTARDMIDLRADHDIVPLAEVKLLVEHRFTEQIPERVYEFLLYHKDAKLTAAQHAIILAWCDEKASMVDFKKSIWYDRYEGWTTDTVEMFCFYARLLDLRHYGTALYLDMLSFYQTRDSLIAVIPFVVRVIGFEQASERILLNLSDYSLEGKLLDDHVKFVQDNDIRTALPLLRDYLLQHPGADHYPILNTYVEMGGIIEELRPMLWTTKGYFRNHLIEQFLKMESPTIKTYLKMRFAEEHNPEERLAITRFLVRLEYTPAVNAYIEHIRLVGYSPDDSSPGNPLYLLRDLKFIGRLLDLYELAQQPSFYQDTFSDLRSITATELQNIVLSGKNYRKARKKISQWIKHRRSIAVKANEQPPEDLLNNIRFFLENYDKQVAAANIEMETQNEAIALYERLRK